MGLTFFSMIGAKYSGSNDTNFEFTIHTALDRNNFGESKPEIMTKSDRIR